MFICVTGSPRLNATSEYVASGLRDRTGTNNARVLFIICVPELLGRLLFHFDLDVVLLDMILSQNELAWILDEYAGVGLFNHIVYYTGC